MAVEEYLSTTVGCYGLWRMCVYDDETSSTRDDLDARETPSPRLLGFKCCSVEPSSIWNRRALLYVDSKSYRIKVVLPPSFEAVDNEEEEDSSLHCSRKWW
ncbi:unnamed protein product [Calypogeia fissa]